MTVATKVDQMSGMSDAAAPQLNGTLSMVVGVKDARHYHKCGLAMNTAWSAMTHNPCSVRTFTASDDMKAMVPECSKLRYGNKYRRSYQALKEDQDTWCG